MKFKMICRAVGTEDGITTVVASTDAVDRYSDVVTQFWNLETFRQNPCIVFGHDYGSAPIGKAVAVDVVEGRLMAQIQWDDADDNPAGKRTARQFAEGFMSAVSVGFSPGSVARRNQLDDDDEYVGKSGMVYGSAEQPNHLMEISAVPIPANPQALAVRSFDAEPVEPFDVKSEILRLIAEDDQIKAEIASMAAEWAQPETKTSGAGWLSGDDI